MTEQIMTVLSASVRDGQSPHRNPQFRECLKIHSYRSEVEFLHGFESCPAALDHADKTGLFFRRGRELFPLWIKLGRPHPVTLRRFLLGIPSIRQFDFDCPAWVSRDELTELLNWSWASYQAVCHVPVCGSEPPSS